MAENSILSQMCEEDEEKGRLRDLGSLHKGWGKEEGGVENLQTRNQKRKGTDTVRMRQKRNNIRGTTTKNSHVPTNRRGQSFDSPLYISAVLLLLRSM